MINLPRRHDAFTNLLVQHLTSIKKPGLRRKLLLFHKLEPRIFEWTTKHQEAFDALKEALSTAPVLGYPDFSREFILEIDASLNGLGAVLSQQGKDGQIRVIAYASRSLRPSERSMRNYSSAKLELLALKWAITEKFRDYLLGLAIPSVHGQQSARLCHGK